MFEFRINKYSEENHLSLISKKEGKMKRSDFFRHFSVATAIFVALTCFLAGAVQLQLGMHMNIGMPSGQFKKNINNNLFGPGFVFYFGVKPTKLPLAVGAKINLIQYGSDCREESMFVPEFGDVHYKVVHSYGMFIGLLYLRFEPLSRGFLQPYAEISAGIDSLATDISIPATSKDSDDGSANLISKNSKSDTVFAYGGECGILINLNRRHTKSKIIDMIEVGVRYSTSRNAEYLHKGSIIIREGKAEYNASFSPVKIFTFHIGYSVRIK
jgi:hypothetical protein